MILGLTTYEFDALTLKSKKTIFQEFVGCKKLDEVIYGSMTNGERGEYKVRHDCYAYSLLRVQPSDCGQTEILIYNYRTKSWQEQPPV